MFKAVKKYSIFFVLALTPLMGEVHKPPILTTGAIIEVYEEDEFQGIVLIERGKAPFGKALPGGKVEYGETVEEAVRREMLEEVNLSLEELKQFHVYSDPARDFRHHSVEVTYTAKAFGPPAAGDDAAKAFVVRLEDIPWSELAFDHANVLQDYIKWREGHFGDLSHNDIVSDYLANFETLARAEKWQEILLQGTIAIEAAQKEGRVEDEAKICAQLTSTAFYSGDYLRALIYAGRSHALAKEFKDPSLFLRALYLESAIYRALAPKQHTEKFVDELYASALETAEKAALLYSEKEIDNLNLKGKIYLNCGAAHADNPKGDLEKAVECYKVALACFHQVGAVDDSIRIAIRMGKVHLLQKNYPLSEQMIAEARAQITNQRLSMQADFLEAQLKLALNEIETAREIARSGLAKARALGAKEDENRFNALLQKE